MFGDFPRQKAAKTLLAPSLPSKVTTFFRFCFLAMLKIEKNIDFQPFQKQVMVFFLQNE